MERFHCLLDNFVIFNDRNDAARFVMNYSFLKLDQVSRAIQSFSGNLFPSFICHTVKWHLSSKQPDMAASWYLLFRNTSSTGTRTCTAIKWHVKWKEKNNLFCQLRDHGYTNIDAIDGSRDMLPLAEEKQLLKQMGLWRYKPREEVDQYLLGSKGYVYIMQKN